MLFKVSLKSLLLALLQGHISHSDLTGLVHLCRSIAESYLTQQRSTLVRVSLLNGLTVADIAYDCIAPIFARDDEGKFFLFQRFAGSLYTDLEQTPEPELILAFKSFILRITKTQLAKIYAQSDPEGAKIHRNMKDCIKKLPDWNLVEDFRGVVLQIAKQDALEHLAAYPVEELERELSARVRGSVNIPDLLGELTGIFAEQTDYRRALRLIDAVQIFRRFYIRFSDLTEIEVSANLDGRLDLEIIQRDVLRTVQEKIISTYVLSGKVNKSEAEILSDIMSDLITDWCENQDHNSLYHYVQRHFAVSESEYESNWRTKIEYLTKIAREKFAACLTENV